MTTNNHLQYAKTVLTAETLKLINKPPYNHYGWKILDRWAYNSPRELKELETQGELVLLSRLLEQQQLEQDALTTTQALEALATGTVPHEILAENEIATEL
ncbi:hypothetical protein P9281_34665 [Caballeronia sp. LP003]|uniref:hypothetical protein n=1 Tax=Caballeronia sp. LP003 TaxID=3038551 RepID=UPI0028631D94|nr:hypothetical protein [Caballeronia sp. LP003]MDR5791692.1 hypothetical protein [Caballeronia sp. LP003]